METHLWKPQDKSKLILDRAIQHVLSVAYAVSLRWLFYRLLQDAIYQGKGDYKRLVDLTSDARKSFYDSWRPDTLADETRDFYIGGDGFESGEAWLQAMADRVEANLDRWVGQPHHIVIMYEAKAMTGQFRQYAPGITLVPFGGDPSIPFKWRIGRHLAAFGC